MARPTLDLHPLAIDEAEAAYDWYAERNPLVAELFGQELDRAISQILDSPERWPSHEQRTRRILLHRFPYMIVYRTTGSAIRVLAVAHVRRRPGYWKTRIS